MIQDNGKIGKGMWSYSKYENGRLSVCICVELSGRRLESENV